MKIQVTSSQIRLELLLLDAAMIQKTTYFVKSLGLQKPPMCQQFLMKNARDVENSLLNSYFPFHESHTCFV